MKLLVLAQTPPPLHGQSQMVQTLLDGLPSRGIEVRHVPLQLSRDSVDIGRLRPGKIFAALRAGFAARLLARHEPFDALYYVPAPGKRAALWRDLAVLSIARPACPRLILHWHAVGLGAWLQTRASALERRLARSLLGQASLSLILAPELADDAAALAPRRITVVANGITDPGPFPVKSPGGPCEVLFLGLGSTEKGLRSTVEAIATLHTHSPGRWHLTFAGNFATPADEVHFQRHASAAPAAFTHAGFATNEKKRALFAAADIFCFPTAYPHEGQPLTLLEALACNVKIVTTRWRAIPGMLPSQSVWFTEAGQPAALARALSAAREASPPAGALRSHFLAHFTREHHLDILAAALRSLAP